MRYEQQWSGWRVTGVSGETGGAERAAERDGGPGAAGKDGVGAVGKKGAGTVGQEDASGTGPVQSVDRAAAILEILAREARPG